jgi:hypothetical protein
MINVTPMNWLTRQMTIVASHNTRWQRKDDMVARVVGGRATRESKSHGLVRFGRVWYGGGGVNTIKSYCI